MSGPLCGLVLDHGPNNRDARFVLTAIAEALHGPYHEKALGGPVLATKTCMSLRSVRQALAFLIQDGWIGHRPGAGRSPSTYRILLDRFPTDAVDRTLAACGMTQPPLPQPEKDPVVVQDVHHEDPVDKPVVVQDVHHESASDAPSAPRNPVVVQEVHPSPYLSVKDSVPPTSQQQIPGVLYDANRVGRKDGRRTADSPITPDPLDVLEAQVLRDVPRHAYPAKAPEIRRLLQTGLRAGHTGDTMHDGLHRLIPNFDLVGGGAVLKRLRSVVTTPPPKPQAVPSHRLVHGCDNCDRGWIEVGEDHRPAPCPTCRPGGRHRIAG